ncbi:hypothetical protein ASPWEDRAFT_69538 [Aspergillus wentii DTO 134E9]|uniref:FAD dependent oxidoreductase domain-containing protein n=1 Tax=Aspergillus wentii DTO 134E9 TaxID=1073089 RepID=A0A1L9RFT9_ASPWE|nr:uncharacterized protein ASPWEDRAFT_69538 [Aspergillus wentii DTO 134E9]OJJ33743.1 hypothetical protein ASPWEDRAFT_69538 [Aspergillus wentii DTO 134E9]
MLQSYTAAHLWSSKLVHQLLARVNLQGLNLQVHTAVSSVCPSKHHDYPWTVGSSRGEIEAKKVVHATNACASSTLLGLFEASVEPIPSHGKKIEAELYSYVGSVPAEMGKILFLAVLFIYWQSAPSTSLSQSMAIME